MSSRYIFTLCLAFLFGFVMAQDIVISRVELTSNVGDVKLPIYAHLQDAAQREYLLVVSSISDLDNSHKNYAVLDFCKNKLAEESYFLALERTPGARINASKFITVIYDDGKQILVRGTHQKAEQLALNGFEIMLLDEAIVVKEPTPVFASLGISYDAQIADMIGQVKTDALKNYVAGLSGEAPVTVGGASYTIVSRYTKSGTPIQQATQYCYEFMQKLGLEVSYHDWTSYSTASRNVIGNKPGTSNPSEIILIMGHLDSMPSSSTLSPGADDNASGSVGVLVAAEILSKYSWNRTLRFVLVTGEEQGLLGSKAYASKVYSAGEKIVAVYNMDMIAWDAEPGTQLRVHIRSTSSSGHAADKAISDIFTSVNTTYSLGLSPIIDADSIQYSDHASFWSKGYPGMLAIEDDEDDFCANYHTNRDKLATLNLDYFTRYVKAGIGTIAHLGGLSK